MRFSLEIEFLEDTITLDYRRKFLSFFKKAFEKYDENIFSSLYGEGKTISKPYTFSVYFGQVKFENNCIRLNESKRVVLNFSTYEIGYGIIFYNSMLKMLNKQYQIAENVLVLRRITLVREPIIKNSKILVKTLSPVIAREHKKDIEIDNYYSYRDDKFLEALKENIERGSKDFFEFDIHDDLTELQIQPVKVNESKILHYDHKFIGNIGEFILEGKPYLLDYLVKAGMGARRSQGFGMLEVEEVRE